MGEFEPRSWSWSAPPWKEYLSLRNVPVPAGPWDDEVDKVQWVDVATGLDCLIVRGTLGALCGYVGVPLEHPWHGKIAEQCLQQTCIGQDCTDWQHRTPASLIEVHGGLNYASACSVTDDEATGVCHVPYPGRPGNVWWFGFDCSHSSDLSPGVGFDLHYGRSDYRELAYVRGEVIGLASQLAQASLFTAR